MLERLNSLWDGDRLGYMEQLCLVSALAVGHRFTLYSYTPSELRNVPDGIEVRDAREVMPKEKLLRYSGSKAVALGTNLFRYALMVNNLGYWVDMDFLFLRPLDFKEPYVFGWESETSINNAVLRIPAHSDMARELCELPRANLCPPWFGPKRTLLYYWARLRKGDIQISDLPWGTFGPGMVTYLARKHGVAGQAQERSVFYPVQYREADALFGPEAIVDEMIRPETHAVHLWHSALFRRINEPPPHGSYLHAACRRHGVKTHCVGS